MLELRKLLASDINTLNNYRRSSEFQKVFPVDINSEEYLNEIEECKKAIACCDKTRYDFGVTMDNKVVGYAIIKECNDDWEIGFELNPVYWNKSIGHQIATMVIEYSFAKLNLKRLIAQCSSTNIGSNKILKKLGMTKINSIKVNDKLIVNKYELNSSIVTL
ncbi:GNAT family N-acetyltransferase [bacterium]|nr:GNAT family N-acetyltransferase [bacterium]